MDSAQERPSAYAGSATRGTAGEADSPCVAWEPQFVGRVVGGLHQEQHRTLDAVPSLTFG